VSPPPQSQSPANFARLLYIHGSGYTEDSFREQLVAFPGSDAVTLPGHPGGEALESIEECSAWFSRYADWRCPGKLVVAGNSLGGAIALRWALDFPDRSAGLILIGTGARLRVSQDIFQMLDENWPACIERLVDWALAPDAAAQLRERVKGWHITVGRESTRRDYAACNRFDVMAELGALRAPTLVVVGSRDQMTPPKYATYLHEHISGSALTVIEDAGHIVMAEKPDEVNAAIRNFLKTAL
jgi:pimeloyl-ACP methyl ester carboxylesterase